MLKTDTKENAQKLIAILNASQEFSAKLIGGSSVCAIEIKLKS